MDPVALARELGTALAGSEEFKTYQKAKHQVEEHEAAKIMLEDFRKKQLALEKKSLGGDEPTSAEIEELKKLSEIMGYNPYIREYLLAEMRFTQLIMEVQKTMADSAGLDFPGLGEEKPAEAHERATEEKAEEKTVEK